MPIETIQQFADYHNLLYIETSSKTGHNVEKTFNEIALKIYELLEEGKVKIQVLYIINSKSKKLKYHLKENLTLNSIFVFSSFLSFIMFINIFDF